VTRALGFPSYFVPYSDVRVGSDGLILTDSKKLVLTCVVAFVFFFTFPSFPEQAKWLTEDEQAYVKARLQADQGRNAAERKVSFRDVLTVMKDHRVWLGGLMYFGLIVPAYGYAYFAPSIISTYRYDAIQTQLYSVPPWAASFAFSIIIAVFSDASKLRSPFAILPQLISIAGFGILLTVHNNTPVQYAALCLVTMGTYGAMPIIVCWFNMNLGGHHRRAIGTAWQIGKTDTRCYLDFFSGFSHMTLD
jgi:predicted MFS family arabinose efflux permease